MNILIFFESIFQKNVGYGISSINAGNNKEVERRYRYYVDYN